MLGGGELAVIASVWLEGGCIVGSGPLHTLTHPLAPLFNISFFSPLPQPTVHCPLGDCPLSTVHCPLSRTHCQWPTVSVHCPLSTAHCPRPTAYCPLPTAHCLLPTAYCLLLKAQWVKGYKTPSPHTLA